MNYGPGNTVLELLGARLAQNELQDYGTHELSHSIEPDATENELHSDQAVANDEQG